MYAGPSLSLNRRVSLLQDDGALLFRCGDRGLRVGQLDQLPIEGLLRLATDGIGLRELTDLASAGGTRSTLSLRLLIETLEERGWLASSVIHDGKTLLTAYPHLESPPGVRTRAEFGQLFVLSRFSYIHRDGAHFTLVSPLGRSDVTLRSAEAATLVFSLVQPRTLEELSGLFQGYDVTRDGVSLLLDSGLICRCTPDGRPDEDADEDLLQWEFHDLAFHGRTREGFHEHPVGGTYRFLGQIAPRPAVAPAMGSRVIDLERPAASSPLSDSDFFSVLDRRESVREHGSSGIRLDELSEFLYRSARLKQVYVTDHGEVCTRPYPGGGGIHELELYIVANRCVGLDRGVYHYRAADQQLEDMNVEFSVAERLLQDAAFASIGSELPDVLIVIAARFQRLSWKYQTIAYSLLLKHVGCLLQTMYLVATAMNLSPCAIGSGNSDTFARMLGRAPYVEPSVGEFMLGSRPDLR